jgi:hypothetical protein
MARIQGSEAARSREMQGQVEAAQVYIYIYIMYIS